MRTKRLFGLHRSAARLIAAALLLPSAAVFSGCTSRQMEGASPSILILDSIFASSGAEPDVFSGELSSDVVTNGGVMEDLMEVTLRTALKDPGSQANPNVPTTTNWITVTRYRVRYVRSDGRNVPGVDVPHPFESGISITALPAGSESVVTLVRPQAKLEAPLRNLAFDPTTAIATIAEITFYGHDQAGREVSVSGTIGVIFANWADPD
jgi:hypothetical protein